MLNYDVTTLEKLRSIRVGQFAIFDFSLAFAGMYWLAPHISMDRTRALWLTLPIGIATHHLLGVGTPFNQMVLGEEPNRLAQLVIAGCLIKGIIHKPALETNLPQSTALPEPAL